MNNKKFDIEEAFRKHVEKRVAEYFILFADLLLYLP
jgi:hypothetical protein